MLKCILWLSRAVFGSAFTTSNFKLENFAGDLLKIFQPSFWEAFEWFVFAYASHYTRWPTGGPISFTQEQLSILFLFWDVYSQQSFLYIRTLQSVVFSLFSSISIGGSPGIRHFERNRCRIFSPVVHQLRFHSIVSPVFTWENRGEDSQKKISCFLLIFPLYSSLEHTTIRLCCDFNRMELETPTTYTTGTLIFSTKFHKLWKPLIRGCFY